VENVSGLTRWDVTLLGPAGPHRRHLRSDKISARPADDAWNAARAGVSADRLVSGCADQAEPNPVELVERHDADTPVRD
jgi:hypothetical protein